MMNDDTAPAPPTEHDIPVDADDAAADAVVEAAVAMAEASAAAAAASEEPKTAEEQAAAAAIAAAAATWCAEDDVHRILSAKDQEIEDLKKALANQTEQISTLQTKLEKAPKRKRRMSKNKTTHRALKDIADEAVAGKEAKKRKGRATDERWKGRFQQLVAYKLEFGDCNVPKSYKKDKSLHAWVRSQRDAKKMLDQDMKRPGRDRMTQERLEALNSIGFQWVVGHQPKDGQWEGMFQQLIEYKQQYGHTQVPTSHPGKLGKWVLNQRSRRRLLEKNGEGKAKGMTWARVEKLDAVDFVWEASARRTKSAPVAAAAVGTSPMEASLIAAPLGAPMHHEV